MLIFTNILFMFTLENANGESSIQVVAKDLDSGSNGQIKYTLVNDFSGFRIDQQTGVITANRLKFDQKSLQKVNDQKHILLLKYINMYCE